MYKDVVYISPKFQVKDFIELNLDIDCSDEIWVRAIDIFKDRMESRFLFIIQDMLGKMKPSLGQIDYSFSIMALNCLFIETLRQFELGLDTTEVKRGSNQNAFIDFFKRSEFFEFSLTTSRIFYKHIRCGILHQAQTQSNTQLTLDQEGMIQQIGNGCIRVDIEKFTGALFSEYESYINKLQDYSETELRNNFIKKMNYIVNNFR